MEYTNSQVREIIAEYIHSERDRAVMVERLCNRVTIERLADNFELSTSQVKRIIQKNQTIIFRHFPEEPKIG